MNILSYSSLFCLEILEDYKFQQVNNIAQYTYIKI